jgi:hypothetical protein
MRKYMFCETATAGSRTPWHIRLISPTGPKYGGGADTPALCGTEVAWDLAVEITNHHLTHACPQCVQAYQQLDARDGSH